MRRPVAALLLASALVPSSTARADEPLSPGASQVVISGWHEQLSEAEDLLHEKQWKKVRRRMDALLREMRARLWAGSSAATLLARGSAMRAIAHAGLGEFDAAAWDWDVAKSLEADLDRIDFGPFGSAGAFFSSEEYRDRTRPPEPAPAGAEASGPPEPGEEHQVTPPRKLYAPPPDYPRAKRFACKEEPILLELFLDLQGVPRAPRLLGEGDPVLYFAATETLRTWRFAPARLGDEKVVVYYNLTVNYRLNHCPGVGRGVGG